MGRSERPVFVAHTLLRLKAPPVSFGNVVYAAVLKLCKMAITGRRELRYFIIILLQIDLIVVFSDLSVDFG